MKNKIAKLISILLCLAVLTAVCSCAKAYKDDATASDLMAKATGAVPVNGGYESPETDFVDFYMSGVSEICTEYSIKLSSEDTNMNEIGIFHAKNSADAKKIADICQKYVDKQKQSSLTVDYLPGEISKYEDAKVMTYGNYVIYTFLNDADRQLVVSAILPLIEK